MSDLRCFFYDIPDLKATDMECMDIAKSEELLEPQDDNLKLEKLKEAHLFLKKKLTLSHELIKQYNDKIKECQNLNMELEAVRNNYEQIMQKHNSSLTEVTELKLENAEYRQKLEHSSKAISDQEIKIAADKQHLEQLICRVKELEHSKSEKMKKDHILKEKIQTLESELRVARKLHETEMKKMETKLNSISAAKIVNTQIIKKEMKITHEKYTCTGNELQADLVKRETRDNCTLTNDFYSIKDDPYPLFCSKCEVKFDTIPLDQILRQMSSCPSLISEVPSPSKKSEKSSIHRNLAAPIEMGISQPEIDETHSNHLSQITQTVGSHSSISKSEFQRLEQKLQHLERKLQKKLKTYNERKNLCCTYQHPSSCYLGPYPYLFQSGAMMNPPHNLVDYQTLQQTPIRRKRRRKLNGNKSSRCGSRLQKKRRIDDGISPWEVSPVARDLYDPDKASFMKNNSELSFESSRSNSSSIQSLDRETSVTKHHKDKESHPLSRREIRNEKLTLFSPITSPTLTPSEHRYTDDKFCSEPYIHTTEVTVEASKATSDGEIPDPAEVLTQSCMRISEFSPELHDKDCTAERPIRDTKKIPKKSAKCSLIKKIRNLKNSHNIKHLVNNTKSVNSNARKSTRNNESKRMVSATEIKSDVSDVQKIQNDANTNDTGIYCPTKKLRIAHNVRKSEDECLSKVNRNSSESTSPSALGKTEIKLVPGSDNATIDTSAVPVNGKLNKFPDDMDSTRCDKQPDLAVTKQCKSSSNDDTIEISNLVNEANVEHEKLVLSRQVISGEAGTERLNNSVVSEPSNNKNTFQLQSCMIRPKMPLEVNSAPDPCDPSEFTESDVSGDAGFETNLNMNVEKHSSGDSLPRVLKSNTELESPIHESLPSCKMKVHDADNIDGKSSESPAKSVSLVLGVELIRYGGTDPSQSFADDEVKQATEVCSDLTPVEPRTSKPASIEILDKGVTSSVIDSQFRGTILSPPNNLDAKTCANFETNHEVMNETVLNTQQISENSNSEYIKVSGLRDLIERYFTSRKNKSCHNSKKSRIMKLQTRKENLVLKELSQISEDPEWTKSGLAMSVERLSKFKKHTIAKCIIDFLSTKAKVHEELDRTHTPPAPLLSKTQQRILTTIVVLNRMIPQIMQLVQDGIQFKLFRLGYAPEVEVVEELSRVFTALARIQKDREKVRILCCDAFYCLGLKAFPLIFVALTSWPEVLPMAGTSSDPLILCLTEMILSTQGDLEFPKFLALKKHVSSYYNYKNDGNGSLTLMKNFMTALKEKRQNGLDAAIILFAKRKAPDWTYKNSIQSLMQMIIQDVHPSVYDAFGLLGHLMRSFPTDDQNGLIRNILEQLCALIESGEGSVELQEGVATALLSFTRYKSEVVASTLMKWTPKEPVSKTLTHRLTTFVEMYPVGWWKKILRSNNMHKY